jgi:hypothetical protein
MLNGGLLTANAQIFGQAQPLHAGADQAKRAEHTFHDGMPGVGILRRGGEMRDVIEQGGGEAEKAIDFFFGGEQAQKEFGQVLVFAWRGEDVTEEAVGHFGEEAAVGRQAGLGEKRDAVGFFQDGGDAGVIPIANGRGRLENRDPDQFSFQIRIGEAGDGFSGGDFIAWQRLGDDAVGFAQEFEKRDEGIETQREGLGGGEAVGTKSEFAQGTVVPVGGREKGENDLAGRVGHGPVRR